MCNTQFEVLRTSFQSWGFTVKRLGSEMPTREDYDAVIEKFKKLCKTISYLVYEEDSEGKLHIHGIIQLDKRFYRKRLQVTGFHMCLREIYDENGWIRYCDKDQPVE